MALGACAHVVTTEHQTAVPVTPVQIIDAVDIYSQANINEVRASHVHMDLTVDFEAQEVRGFVEHELARVNERATQFILDTRDLLIQSVEIQNPQGDWQPTQFEIGERDNLLGSALSVTIERDTRKVRVYYTTMPDTAGLGWFSPAQTHGGVQPFLMTHGQTIDIRGWLPIQDTPTVRLTYSANIHTPPDLLAVMSADNDPDAVRDGEYAFDMPQPIPAYLIALAVGDLEFAPTSDITGVYAEPEILAAAQSEFEDAPAMMAAAEALYGPYLWGRYDLLTMPAGYPSGGMENPRLTFISSALIAGDKSLVVTLAHEIAHSWSGNLATNATWADIWINEGFSSYVAVRLVEAVYGTDRALMEWSLIARDLDEMAETALPRNTMIYRVPPPRNPDYYFNTAAYNKGQFFLLFLEQRFGREVFDPFLKRFFEDHAFQSVSTAQLENYFLENLIEAHPGIVTAEEMQEWIHGIGMPANSPHPTSDHFDLVSAHLDSWLAGNEALSEIPTQGWSPREWIHFINSLPKYTSTDQIMQLDTQYGLTQTRNPELGSAWLVQAVRHGHPDLEAVLATYLTTIGRSSYVRPIYYALSRTGDGLALGQHLYEIAGPGYHSSVQSSIERILGLES
jgi:leukotriene-A4 hydrolase